MSKKFHQSNVEEETHDKDDGSSMDIEIKALKARGKGCNKAKKRNFQIEDNFGCVVVVYSNVSSHVMWKFESKGRDEFAIE